MDQANARRRGGRADSPSPPAPPGSAAGLSGGGGDGLAARLGSRGGWLLALNLGLAGVAYHALLQSPFVGSVQHEVEAFLFEASDTWPPVVIALALWLLYRRRRELAAVPWGRGAPRLATPLLIAGPAVLAWSTYTRAPDLLVPSLMLNGLGLAALFGGLPALRIVLLPCLCLIFAMPLPAPLRADIVFRFQLWTADYAGWLLGLLDVPHVVSGDQILRPRDTFAIIENCSGLRSVETLTLITLLMVDLFRRRGVHAALLLLAAPLAAFAMNGFRVVALILNPHSDVASIHTAQGVAILLGGLLTLYAFDGLLSRVLPNRPRAGARTARVPSPENGIPAHRSAAATALLALCALLAVWGPSWEPAEARPLYLEQYFAEGPDGWSSRELGIDHSFLGRVGLREMLHRRYRKGPDGVTLFLGVETRLSRMTTPFSPKTALTGSGWIVEEESGIHLGDGIEARARVARKGAKRLLVYHWFEGAQGLWSETLRSLLALERSPLAKADHGLVVRLSTPMRGAGPVERREAADRLEAFLAALKPRLARLRGRLGALPREEGEK